MEVKSHLGSPEVKRSKPCKRCISRTVSQRDLIIGVWVGHIEYCRWSLSFLVEIKVHLGSPEVKRSRLCTHCNLRRVVVRDLKLSMRIANIVYMISVVFGGGQR